ncbi:hypothetical protein Q765_12920 [Flavobacterium rivuli WB 3.3-2 = DSM 21788]|uniref:Lipoprotein n=1 Tax=Flavobacterium rivuli WB 3.3-2 = DSM 21788 TaxID=1121895 RepID=A0A0A2M3B3_9FLAO|nr:hypothetical protein [Flavobacterium rivuli]KGO85963.1 hypothetical protein Q765_12920 [Flavobacterium rivuli WB 3.3-2 = DSM 21788]
MKHLKKVFIFLFAALMASCSSEDADAVNDGTTPITGADNFTYKIDGRTVAINNTIAQRSGSTIAVAGYAADGTAIAVEFNEFGNLKDITAYSISNFDVPTRSEYHYFKSNYINFELVAIDATAKKVKVTFSGKVYDEEYDLTSDYSTVEGSFQVTYRDVVPEVAGLGVFAKINNENWYTTDITQSGGFFPGSDITLNESNDSKYTIGIITNHDNSTVGTHSFGPAVSSNKVILSEYNTTTHEDVEYTSTTGTIKITAKTTNILYTIIEGTFSLTARHPTNGTTVTVTDGTFKSVYTNY